MAITGKLPLPQWDLRRRATADAFNAALTGGPLPAARTDATGVGDLRVRLDDVAPATAEPHELVISRRPRETGGPPPGPQPRRPEPLVSLGNPPPASASPPALPLNATAAIEALAAGRMRQVNVRLESPEAAVTVDASRGVALVSVASPDAAQILRSPVAGFENASIAGGRHDPQLALEPFVARRGAPREAPRRMDLVPLTPDWAIMTVQPPVVRAEPSGAVHHGAPSSEELRLVDLRNGRLLDWTSMAPVHLAAMTGQGLLAVASNGFDAAGDRFARVWFLSLPEGDERRFAPRAQCLIGFPGEITAMTRGPGEGVWLTTGQRIYALGANGEVVAHKRLPSDMGRPLFLGFCHPQAELGGAAGVPSLAGRLVVATANGLHLWEVFAGDRRGWAIAPYLDVPSRVVITSCAVSADGEYLVSGHVDGTLRIWEAFPVSAEYLRAPRRVFSTDSTDLGDSGLAPTRQSEHRRPAEGSPPRRVGITSIAIGPNNSSIVAVRQFGDANATLSRFTPSQDSGFCVLF